VCVSVCVCVCVCVCVRARSLIHPACKAHAPYYIIISGLSYSTILFNMSSTARFSKNKKFTERKIYFDFLYNFCLRHFSF